MAALIAPSVGTQQAHEHYQQLIPSTTTSDPIYPHNGLQILTVGLIPASGASGKVQYTLSPTSAVQSGTATWRDWPAGVVAVTTDDVLTGPVTALRGVSVSGAVTIEIVG